MRLNTIMAKAVRVEQDPNLRKYLRENIVDILGCDQICFRENTAVKHHYKTQLGYEQRARGDPLIEFMKEEYDIHLNVFNDFSFMGQDESYKKLDKELENVDPYMLMAIYTIANSTKSTVVSLALLKEHITLEEAILVSRLEEIFQQRFFGVVEGAHDYDEARTIADVSAAKCFVNLLQ